MCALALEEGLVAERRGLRLTGMSHVPEWTCSQKKSRSSQGQQDSPGTSSCQSSGFPRSPGHSGPSPWQLLSGIYIQGHGHERCPCHFWLSPGGGFFLFHISTGLSSLHCPGCHGDSPSPLFPPKQAFTLGFTTRGLPLAPSYPGCRKQK